MTGIELLEYKIQRLKEQILMDMKVLRNLESVKHKYYANMMGRKERYETD